ncbi:hypothetical protein chiPu_0027753, partial [Chiloscyllium punctatum]|nr:hypothetical protein [Chiloscyllium punctatum]
RDGDAYKSGGEVDLLTKKNIPAGLRKDYFEDYSSEAI